MQVCVFVGGKGGGVDGGGMSGGYLATACWATTFSVSSLSQGMTCCSISLCTGSNEKPESCNRPYTVPVNPAGQAPLVAWAVHDQL